MDFRMVPAWLEGPGGAQTLAKQDNVHTRDQRAETHERDIPPRTRAHYAGVPAQTAEVC